MLRVTIEIVPHGDESRKRTIEQMTLALRSDSPLPLVGHYDVEVRKEKFHGHDAKMFLTDRFIVRDHPRAHGARELVRRALEIACGVGREDAEPDGYKIEAWRQLPPEEIVHRGDGRIERLCTHGVGHPIAVEGRACRPTDWVHGCDGCCAQWKGLV